MSKTEKKKLIGVLLVIAAVVMSVIVIMVNLATGSTTGDVTISGDGSMSGIKCTDVTLMHPAFADVQPVSHNNTITANFVDDTLSSIMYRYDGIYQSEEEAANARVLAEADYNLILANEYHVPIDIFTHSFMTDGVRISLTVSSGADKVTSSTAPYFLLEQTNSFPKTLDELKAAYGAKGMSCEVENEK